MSYPGNDLETSNSIRLLKIHTADVQTSMIACTLQSVNLMQGPRYRALSYTRGPATEAFSTEYEPLAFSDDEQQILCNGQVFFVPQNLADALLELRQSGFPEWLWVDAICINRSNTEERLGQISIMGQIYKSAVETVAWLGKDESGIDDVRWGIDVMIPRLLQRGPACWDSRPLKDLELKDIFGTDDLSRRVIGIRTFLATRTWLHRAWVAQEVALAPSVCILAGHHHFSWTDLTNLSILLAEVPLDNQVVPRSQELNRAFSAAKASLVKLQVLRDLVPRQVSNHAFLPVPELHETYRFLETRYGTKTELESAAAWLAYLLSLARAMESTERHDKIYSILGMAKLFSSEIDELVTPDYDRPIESVYTSVTTRLLLHNRYLSTLAQAADISDRVLPDLPSWVIDYSSINASKPILEFGKGQATHFDASLTSELPLFPRRIEGSKLTLVGAKFDHISAVSPVTFNQLLDESCHLEEFLSFVANLPNRYLDGRSRTEVLWRAMMMDSEETAQSINHPPASIFARRFQSWMIDRIGLWVADAVHKGMEVGAASKSARQFFAQLYPDPKIEVPEEIQRDAEAFTLYHRKRMLPFVRSIEAKVSGRRLFQTRNKFVGMGPHSIQADDQVWLIRDSKTPLILRPKPASQHFLLVGEAYLHGFMHGEMLDSRWDLDKRIGPVTIV
jgi:Heterokaryon incompatibility protein (HET)